MGMFPGKEGGIQVLAGVAPSSQTVGSYLRTSLAGKSIQKNSTKREYSEFTSMEKCTQTFDEMHSAKKIF
jgi:hypothetical protein